MELENDTHLSGSACNKIMKKVSLKLGFACSEPLRALHVDVEMLTSTTRDIFDPWPLISRAISAGTPVPATTFLGGDNGENKASSVLGVLSYCFS